jgi:hypothetical protein
MGTIKKIAGKLVLINSNFRVVSFSISRVSFSPSVIMNMDRHKSVT